MRFIIIIVLYLLFDFYAFQLVRTQFADTSDTTRKIVYVIYWLISFSALAAMPVIASLDPFKQRALRTFLLSFVVISLISKVFVSFFLLIDDLWRGLQWVASKFSKEDTEPVDIGRSKFLTTTAVVAGALPILTMSFGIISGAYDYRVRRRTVYFPDLPKEFDGIKVIQLSDIHSGSFYNKTAVKGGVDLAMAEKPDIICFTGDLVNDQSKEVEDYVPVFEKLQAPLGVYSIMGNHDYGDYRQWSSREAKQNDIKNLHRAHAEMGWNLMLNENQTIRVDSAEIGMLGVENWGKGRFSKYGDLSATVAGTEDLPFKILMSHDPSHWEAQVIPDTNIDLTLSGHTHGFQFGVEIGDFRWSPSKYLYKQWADLYQKDNRYIYVNRGFGFLGYPGRVGILPEITVLELKRGQA
ncbi:MAG: metallophosphoesterase [Cyclobacteriaceae bacterium]